MKRSLFPLPIHSQSQGLDNDGLVVQRHPQCANCRDLFCLADEAISTSVRICENGFCYARPTKDLTIWGFLLSDWVPPLQVGKVRVRRYKRLLNSTWPASFCLRRSAEECIRGIALLEQEEKDDNRLQIRRIAEATIDHDATEEQVREILEARLQTAPANIQHDTRQLLSLISQHADGVLIDKFCADGTDWNEVRPAFSNLSEYNALKAIFYLTRIVTSRLDMLFSRPSDTTPSWFSAHGTLLKFSRMYEPLAASRNVKLSLSSDWTRCFAPQQSVEIVFHALIDNAIKYSPPGAVVYLDVIAPVSSGHRATIRVRSLGPRLTDSDRQKIFGPAFRSDAAIATGVEGSGLGLYQAKSALARGQWGSIEVQQDSARDGSGYFWTTFSVSITIAEARRESIIP